MVSKKLPAAADLVDLPCNHYDYSDVSTVTSLENVLLIVYSSSRNYFFNHKLITYSTKLNITYSTNPSYNTNITYST